MFTILLLIFTSVVVGQEAVIIRLGGEVIPADQIQEKKTSTAEPISIDVVQADIHNVIRLFATHTGHNFVISDGVEGKVTAKIEKVPWDEALVAILWSKGLVAINLGDVTIITLQ
jgi:type II secretory pathway component HofQ